MAEELYPKEFLRGIANKGFIENGHVLYTAFQFDDNREGLKAKAT